MLIEYRVLRVEFRNYKLLSSFAGILKGLLGLQQLDTFPRGLKREGIKIVRECKSTGGRSCQAYMQMVVSSWQRTVWTGGRVAACGCLWHTVSIWHQWHNKNVHPYNTTTTLIADDNPTSSLCIWVISPPSIQTDNSAMKIKPMCLLATGAAVCAMNVDGL